MRQGGVELIRTYRVHSQECCLEGLRDCKSNSNCNQTSRSVPHAHAFDDVDLCHWRSESVSQTPTAKSSTRYSAFLHSLASLVRTWKKNRIVRVYRKGLLTSFGMKSRKPCNMLMEAFSSRERFTLNMLLH